MKKKCVSIPIIDLLTITIVERYTTETKEKLFHLAKKALHYPCEETTTNSKMNQYICLQILKNKYTFLK